MKKIITLLIGLALFAMNAIAAVNVNTATQAQLESINNIGPVKAKAIIDYRTKNGPFKTVDDLEKVSGIGKTILAKIKADVTVSGETTVKAEAKPADKMVDDKKPAAKEEPKKADDKNCEAKAAEKKLAGAAKTTFMKKCEADAAKPAAPAKAEEKKAEPAKPAVPAKK